MLYLVPTFDFMFSATPDAEVQNGTALCQAILQQLQQPGYMRGEPSYIIAQPFKIS
jgi:hypothetical protein